MNKRINIAELEPAAYQAMFGLEGYLAKTDLDGTLKELVKTRASQINGCAYCIQMHTEAARKAGESEQRLYALAAWQESPLFSSEERAVLSLTEAVTMISEDGVPESVYEEALDALGQNKLAQCIMLIATINAWNRMAVTTRMQHE